MYSHSLRCYGPLSEVIQVKGALALMQIEINGMYIDQVQLKKVRLFTHSRFIITKVEADMARQLSESVSEILANPEYDGSVQNSSHLFMFI